MNDDDPGEQTALHLDLGDAAPAWTAPLPEPGPTAAPGKKTAARTPAGKKKKTAPAAPDAALLDEARALFDRLGALDLDTRIETVNALRVALHERSPFRGEPVDLVLWVPQSAVRANDYNPNVVAPPQKRTLRRSIERSGFTQPIVSWPTAPGEFEVVDGFHRNLVTRETPALGRRMHGRLPVTVVRSDRRDRAARIEATIVHNEARGRHTIQGEEDVVLELARLGKSDEFIADELGMDPDKVLRLKQQAGLATLYAEDEFSEAFEVDNAGDPFALPDEDGPGR